MSHQSDPLAGLYEEESPVQTSEEQSDPLSGLYEDSPKKARPYRDVVSERLRELGVEPDFGEELERAAEFGQDAAYQYGEFGKGTLSGATLGFSEHIDALKPEGGTASTIGEITGSFLPITGLLKVFNNPLTKMASKSPILQKQLSSLANLVNPTVSSALAGGTYGAITEANKNKEMPSVDDFIEHGAMWAVLDTALRAGGGLTRFIKALLEKSKSTGKPDWKIVNETIEAMRKEGVDFSNPERVNAKALSILEEGSLDKAGKPIKVSQKKGPGEIETLAKEKINKDAEVIANDFKNKKVDQQIFDKLNAQNQLKIVQPGEFEALEVVEEAISKEIEEGLEGISERVPTEKQLGENIKANIDSGLKKAENAYRPAYELAEDAAKGISSFPVNLGSYAENMIKELQLLKTQPEGFPKVIKTLQNALEDAGFVLNPKPTGELDFVVLADQVNTSRLMELGRRINKVINYDSIDKSVQDVLKPFVQEIKKDIRTALKGHPGALEMYEEAEKEFIKQAKVFGKDSIRKIRKTDAGEKVAKLIRTPTILSDLKEATSPEQYKQIERELLEHIKNQNEERARALYREIRPSLSVDSQAVAEEIIQSKAPKGSTRTETLRNKIRETLYNDLSRSSITGERPDNALKLWKTKEGQQIIKDTLKDNPNKKEILDYLANQSLRDISESIISPSGEINFKKLHEFMKDPNFYENIRLIGGEEGVNFFKNLETLSNRAKKNLSIIDGKIDKSSARERLELYKTLERKGQKKLEEVSQKNKIKTKEKGIFQEKVGEKSTKQENIAQKELREAEEKRGRQKLQEFSEKSAQVQKDSLTYKIDEIFKTYGIKAKGVLSLLGFSKFGIPGVIEGAAIYEAMKYLAKNKRVQNAIKQMAGPKTDLTYLFGAYESLDKATSD